MTTHACAVEELSQTTREPANAGLPLVALGSFTAQGSIRKILIMKRLILSLSLFLSWATPVWAMMAIYL